MTSSPSLLTTYQSEHLGPVYREVGHTLLTAFVEASLAHVVMLRETYLLPAPVAGKYLAGLRRLNPLPEYDGSFEDTYYALERLLAETIGEDPSTLSLQLARSRNDLDQAAFRLILRRQTLVNAQALHSLIGHLLERADQLADTVIVGYTHRRPAQPTTIGHVLAGFAEAALAHARQFEHVLDELDRSPLGSCAFAGTDLPIDPARLSELLGFREVVANSYQAVAGADHLIQLAATNAQTLASGSRLTRTLLEWLTHGWIATPAEFCQGSSIMPQKQNPVVLEHLISYANEEIAAAAFVTSNVAAAWWEDSNNATTDVQTTLWASNDRARRFLTLLSRFIEILEVQTPPTDAEIVATGATTTQAADALALAGIPFRAAHSLIGVLVRAQAPGDWTVAAIQQAAQHLSPPMSIDAALATTVIEAAVTPAIVTRRTQTDGPGAAAVREQVARFRTELAGHMEAYRSIRDRHRAARTLLKQRVAELARASRDELSFHATEI